MSSTQQTRGRLDPTSASLALNAPLWQRSLLKPLQGGLQVPHTGYSYTPRFLFRPWTSMSVTPLTHCCEHEHLSPPRGLIKGLGHPSHTWMLFSHTTGSQTPSGANVLLIFPYKSSTTDCSKHWPEHLDIRVVTSYSSVQAELVFRARSIWYKMTRCFYIVIHKLQSEVPSEVFQRKTDL